MGILDRAELLLQAKNYSGTGDWLDESGNSHDAQLGSTSGADTNDPVFKAYDPNDGVYVNLPGTASNYLSMPDTNLLDADAAHMVQAKASDAVPAAPWFSGFGAVSTVDAQTAGFFGARLVSDSTGTIRFNTGAGHDVPVSPGADMVCSAWIRNTSTADRSFRFALITGDGDAVGSFTNIPAGTGVRLVQTLAIPAGGVDGPMWVQMSNAQVGDSFECSDFCVELAGGSGEFVPSLRIVGDLDVQADVAIPDATNIGDIVSRWDGAEQSFRFFNTGDGSLTAWVQQPGPRTEARASNTGLITDGVRNVCRFTYQAASGLISFYVNGTAEGGGGFTPNSMLVSAAELSVAARNSGANNQLEADVYGGWVRDGIDGPIVAQFNPADASEPWATFTDSESGQDWTVSRSSSGYVSTFVDRDMFLLSTDDYFVVPDDDGLDFAADESFTLFAVSVPTTDSGTHVLADKGAAAGAAGGGYTMFGSGATLIAGIADGAANKNATIADAMVPNTLAVYALLRDVTADEVQPFLSGVAGTAQTDTTTASLANSTDLSIGKYNVVSGPFEGQIIAVALFREALTDQEIIDVGNALLAEYDVTEATLLHGDALWNWMLAQPGIVASLSTTDTELVGALNELNSTEGEEYAEARGTFLGIDPAG